MEELKIILICFLIPFLGLATFIVIFGIVGTILHELWHTIAAKILKGKVYGIAWFDFKNFLKSLKSNDEISIGGLYVHLPLEKERYRWIVDLAGGVGAGLTLVVVGALILALTIKYPFSFSVFHLIGGVVILSGFVEFIIGIQECRKKKSL